MNFFERILVFLDSKMTRPTTFGWFHIMFVILLIIAIIYICKRYKGNEKQGKKIILFLSILCLCFEVYKQINFSFNYDGNLTWWKFQWYAFPFQFCSTPMYVGLIASIIKRKETKNSLYYFLATYGLLGGLITMIYPESCFIETIGINIQTMVHHSSMILMGVCVISCLNLKFNFKSFLKSTKIFLYLVFIALFINITTYYLNINNGLEMFYISPFHNSSLPILSTFDEKLPYIPFLLTYLLLFASGCLLITYLIKWFSKKKVS